MNGFTKFVAEIYALAEEAAQRMERWQEDERAKQYPCSVDLTTMLVFGEISAETYAVRLLSSRRFEQQTQLLKAPASETHEAMAARFRHAEALRQEQKLLDDLFKVLVERELPEAGQYYAWEVHPSGQVYVQPSATHKDTRCIAYLRGETQATAVSL